MTASRLQYAVKRYDAAIAILETHAALAQGDAAANLHDAGLVDAILEVLAARDAVQVALASRNHIAPSGHLIRRVKELDSLLNQHQLLINRFVKLADWREVLNPPNKDWWWAMDDKPSVPLHDRFDPFWQGLSIIFLTAAASLLAAMSTRFFRGGPDELGLSAILISSVMTLLTAGGALTRGGRQAIEHLLISLKVSKHLWDELACLVSLLLLVLMALSWQALPLLSHRYALVGNEALQRERLVEAREAYERATQIDPENINAHLRLGQTYEKMPDARKAVERYEIAIRSGRLPEVDLLPTYNSLITLETRRRNYEQAENWLHECQNQLPQQLANCAIETLVKSYLTNKKYVEVSALLISDRNKFSQVSNFGHYPPGKRYQILTYLGQAFLEQKNSAPAEQALRQAITLIETNAPAHCLLAQVLEQRQELAQAKAEWELCIAYGSLKDPEESAWMNQARQRWAELGD